MDSGAALRLDQRTTYGIRNFKKEPALFECRMGDKKEGKMETVTLFSLSCLPQQYSKATL